MSGEGGAERWTGLTKHHSTESKLPTLLLVADEKVLMYDGSANV